MYCMKFKDFTFYLSFRYYGLLLRTMQEHQLQLHKLMMTLYQLNHPHRLLHVQLMMIQFLHQPATTAKMVSKKLQANLKPPQRTRSHQTNSKITGCTQTIITYKTVSTQTDQGDQHINADTFTKHVEDEDDNYSDGDDDDDDYQPTYDESSTDDDDCEVQQMNYKLSPESSPLDEKQFVVSESALYQILSVCQYCCSEATSYIQYTKGTLISTTSVCINGHISMWKNQPSHKSMPWSNLMTATAIMCSGVNAAKALKMFEHMSLQMFSSRTYTRLQSLHVAPSATVTWDSEQATLLQEMNNRPVVLGDDARCYSPEYSAKYGSYTLMDLVTKKILDFQLVQVCIYVEIPLPIPRRYDYYICTKVAQ